MIRADTFAAAFEKPTTLVCELGANAHVHGAEGASWREVPVQAGVSRRGGGLYPRWTFVRQGHQELSGGCERLAMPSDDDPQRVFRIGYPSAYSRRFITA